MTEIILDRTGLTGTDSFHTIHNYIDTDEAPMAYKSLEDIIDVVAESADILEVMKPIYNFKAPETISFSK